MNKLIESTIEEINYAVAKINAITDKPALDKAKDGSE